MNLFDPVIRENLENLLLEESHYLFPDEAGLPELKQHVIDIIGPERTPRVDGDWDAWLETVIQSKLSDRQLISLYIKLLENNIVPRDFAEGVNIVLEQQKYSLFYNNDAQRWWFIDEGIEAMAYSIVEAVNLVIAHNLAEVDESLKEAEEKRVMAEWEFVVWKCSKALEAVGRHCLRTKMLAVGDTPRPNMPMMARCLEKLQQYQFFTPDDPLAKLFENFKDDFRNPTSHLDSNPNEPRPTNHRDCDNEEDATLSFVLSHLIIYQMLKRL